MLGSRSAAARAIGVGRSVVSMWCDGSSQLPLLRAIQIEQLLDGEIRAEQLRPDAAHAFAYLRSSTAHKRQSAPAVAKKQQTKRNEA